MSRENVLRIVKGSSRTYRLTFTRAEDVDEDTNPEGRFDLTSSTVYWRAKRHASDADAVIGKSSGNPTEIDILTQSGTTLGQADVLLVPSDTAGLDAGEYVYDAWVVTAADVRHASIEPTDLVLFDPATDLSAAAPSAPGVAATQNESERSFKFTVPSDGDSFPVTIPGSGMFDTSYVVEATISDLPAGAPLVQSYALETGRTVTQFTLEFSGDATAATVVDILVRDS